MALFGGARVLAFESRRAKEMGELIRINSGEPILAPVLVEVPLEDNHEAYGFADRLNAAAFDMVIFLTGVGARYLGKVIAARDGEARLIENLRKVAVVARGPKPTAVLREWNVPVTVQVPEPNTYRELLQAIKNTPGMNVAVQEYGRLNPELLVGLERQGRRVTSVPVYQWKLTDETAPLADALGRLCNHGIDVALFTTGVQMELFLGFAEAQGKRAEVLEALGRCFIGSIGPTCTEALAEVGLRPALEPSHPKMGLLVREAAIAYEASVSATESCTPGSNRA